MFYTVNLIYFSRYDKNDLYLGSIAPPNVTFDPEQYKVHAYTSKLYSASTIQ